MNDFHKWSYLCGLCLYLIVVADAGVLPLARENSVENGTPTAELEPSKKLTGFIEYQPNGTIILRSASLRNATHQESAALFQTILKAIKVRAPSHDKAQSALTTTTKFNIKIYGEGIEHKFPPFLERIIQRIQTYFSVYRYTDTSRPVQPETLDPTAIATDSYGGGSAAGNTQSDSNYLTTTIIEIGNSPANVANDGLSNTTLDNLEQTTPFINDNVDANTNDIINGNEDYPEFIEIKSNDGIIRKDQD